MALKEFIDKMRGRSFIDSSHTVIPSSGGGFGETLQEIVKIMIDDDNVKNLSNINEEQAFLGAILDAAVNVKDDRNLELFYMLLIDNLFLLSSSIAGRRSREIQDISIGRISYEQQLEMQQMRSGNIENNDLKGVN